MAYDIKLAERVRCILAECTEVAEKQMFSGICFMVNGKMCVCVSHEELLCRIGASEVAQVLETGDCWQMINNGRISRDYVFVAPEGFKTSAQLRRWIRLCLAFNPLAKASKNKE